MVKMVDITQKEDVIRIATAEGFIRLKKETINAIKEKRVPKGDVLTTAKISSILAVKKTADLIPMCHPIPITSVDVDFKIFEEGIKVICKVKSIGKTGVEMEALMGVSVALLTIWDMVKSMEKDEAGQYPYTTIEWIRVVEKVKENI
ncbi:MAG TPA: cyclic pyranopterin monophosphate synthase MoaC [Archaeoglobus profundus]|nr:cyclic pyranopterin monophosphate synthase MoaC [Archaeoglobus profundus]